MGARDDILAAVRRASVPPCDHPGVAGLGAGLDDLPGRFSEMVAAAGGRCVRVADLTGADRVLRELPAYREAGRVATLVPGVGEGTVDPSGIDEPHALDGLDLCVLRGELGVAENGAVWIDGRLLPHQALVVIAEHLAIVVQARALVADMHQAYARLDVGRGFGLWLAGPSKTADIEQALVVGAHGARSCVVLLVG